MDRCKKQRIVALIDMDCFYVQCEQRLDPDKWGKPCGVAQYNKWKGGGLIAVNYEARPFGIKRGMRGDEAKKLCPDFHLFMVPELNGKACLDRYRSASADVFNVIIDFIQQEEQKLNEKDLIILERASVDEAYLDLTKLVDAKQLNYPELEHLNQFRTKLEFNKIELDDWLLGMKDQSDLTENDDKRLLEGAKVVGQLRQTIVERTQFRCSAGISHNKMLSKLACGINKPNSQTILPMSGVAALFRRIDISDVRSLGGKLGRQVKEIFAIRTMHELHQIEAYRLRQAFDEKTSQWLHFLSAGHDDELVSDRRMAKSIGCGKNFRGKEALARLVDVHHWIRILCSEVHQRLEKDQNQNRRLAKLMVVSFFTPSKGHCSRSISLDISSGRYSSPENMASSIMKQVFPNMTGLDPIQNLSLAATKFVDEEKIASTSNKKIETFFKKINRVKVQDSLDESQFFSDNESDEEREENKKSPAKRKVNTIENYFQSDLFQHKFNEKMKKSNETKENNIDFHIDEDSVDEKMNDDFDLLNESFFFKKIVQMLENGEIDF